MEARKILKYSVLLVVLVNLVLMTVVFLGSPSRKPTPMPNPNGSDDFLKAALMLNGNLAAYKTMKHDELAALVSTNQAALKLLETGINRKCRLPDDYTADFVSQKLQPLLSGCKSSECLFCAAGEVAELEGRTNDAVKFYLEGIRFGEECSRGGVLITKLVGIACESMGGAPLERLRLNLDAKQCAEIARSLEAIDANAESDEEILQHEKTFENKTSSVREKLARLVSYKNVQASRKRVLDRIQNWTITRRKTMIAFAARAYELDKGKHPASLADLAPEYLKSIPQDPATGTNMAYRP